MEDFNLFKTLMESDHGVIPIAGRNPGLEQASTMGEMTRSISITFEIKKIGVDLYTFKYKMENNDAKTK